MSEHLRPNGWNNQADVWLWGGLTAVVIGYLLVWLPHPAVGLSFIGVDIGEWVKFLPQMQAGQLPNRNLFYLPPITAGLLLALLTAGWDNRRWQTWGARLTAVGIALLAFPSLDALRFEPASEWQLRLGWIGLVGVTAVGAAWLGRWPKVVYGLLLVTAVVGAILPLHAYLAVRPVVAALIGQPIGIGWGVWLSTAGYLLILARLVEVRGDVGKKVKSEK
jgi:hypothetical protein